MVRLEQATSPAQLEAARTLLREYRAAVGADLCFQGFEAELAALPGGYAPPAGRLLLAYDGEALAGCGALRALGPGAAELKRMWTRPACRGRGVARAVAAALLEAARAQGYRAVRLETLTGMGAARALYASLGFRELPADAPDPLPGVVLMELAL